MKSKVKDTISTLANVPKLFRLIWKASSVYTILLSFIVLLQGILPVCKLWVGKLIVDSVVRAVNSQIPGADLRKVFMLAALELSLVLASNLMEKLYTFIQGIVRDIFTIHANTLLLNKSIELDLAYYETPAFYDKLRMAQQDAGGSSIFVLEQIFRLIQYFISIISMLALFTRLGWFILLFVILTTLPNLTTGMKYSRNRYTLRIYQTPKGRKSRYFTEVLTSNDYAKEVRLFGLGHYFIRKWRDIYEQFRLENRSLALKQSIASFLAELSSTCGYYGCYAYILYKAVFKDITLGDMTMYAQALYRSQSLMQSIFYAISAIYEHTLNVTNFFAFLKLNPNIINIANPKPFPTPIKEGIEFKNVFFRYPGGSELVLHDVNFKIRPGENIALVGENGAGKTTLIKLLARLYNPTEGDIFIDGENVKAFDISELTSNIGVIFQDYARYYASVRENIAFGNLDKMGEITQIIKSARKSGADEFINRLPHEYDTMLGKRFDDGVELSIGQWQKIALARAFMRDAPILILDEPTASLDARTEYEIFKRFQELTDGKTTILISHRFSTVRMADRIFVIEKGRMVENGSHDELMELNSKYAQMFNMQAESYQMESRPAPKS